MSRPRLAPAAHAAAPQSSVIVSYAGRARIFAGYDELRAAVLVDCEPQLAAREAHAFARGRRLRETQLAAVFTVGLIAGPLLLAAARVLP